MRSALLLAVPCALLAGAMAFSCGGSNGGGSGFGDGGSGSGGGSGGGDDATSSGGDDGACGVIGCGGDDATNVGCQGLQCQWTPCSSTGKPETQLTGTVYDPAGNLPLYDVYVYVPNTQPLPITAGGPYGCSPCEAPATGSPIIGRLTKADGTFDIQHATGDQWGVPAGDNIPLVIQVGKWRKQLVIPHIDACTTVNLNTVFNGGTGKARQLRLPAKSSEGDMPLMAFTSGCDPAECFLRNIGIDDSEFVAPNSPVPPPWKAGQQPTPGAGHVQFFTAWDGTAGSIPASAVTGGNTPAATYGWWGTSANLLKYDIVFNACECNPNDRGGASYGAMHGFLNGGGRLFTTHYYYNWFAPPTGPVDFQKVVAWNPGGAQSFGTYFVDTSFPKGQAYGDWLVNVGVGTKVGNGVSVPLVDLRNDIDGSGPPTFPGSTRWIYDANGVGGNPYGTDYMSFNTPIGTPVASQCGRAVFSDVHLSGVSNDGTFPAECTNPNIDSPPGHAGNEKALEFLFFDLSSCVQDDTKPPPPPPPQ
ncbi:MAG TPA: hypothetical protein VIF15_03725 [Polyangiaceae bacterium]|jgi:hypothetical protein